MPETLIKHTDVTGVLLHFTADQINRMMHALPEEQRRFAPLMADTLKHPHEIWKNWERDKEDPKQWRNVRYYLQFLDLSETEIKGGFGVIVMQFTFMTRWLLSGASVALGSRDQVLQDISASVRQGSIEYSVDQH